MVKIIDKEELIRGKLARGKVSPVKMYRSLTTGQQGWGYFFVYEFLTCLFGPMPGALGFFFRKKLYPLLFKSSGKGLIIGRNVVIRHPRSITLGDYVTIDDNCLIDARGSGPDGIVFSDEVILNRNSMVLAKAGPVHFGKRTSVGSNSVVVSMDGIVTEEAVLMAGGCYLSAGAYQFDELDKPVMDQASYSKGPIVVGAGAWLGTGVLVLDGITIGRGAVIGAGAVVTRDVPDGGVSVGVPARVLRNRRDKDRIV